VCVLARTIQFSKNRRLVRPWRLTPLSSRRPELAWKAVPRSVAARL